MFRLSHTGAYSAVKDQWQADVGPAEQDGQAAQDYDVFSHVECRHFPDIVRRNLRRQPEHVHDSSPPEHVGREPPLPA